MSIPVSLPKPKEGESCNGCGYCCTMQPCLLAQQVLNCATGPCVALEARAGRNICGLVRNPLAYIYKSAHPEQDVPVLDDAPDSEVGRELSADLAAALGIGRGCDSSDNEVSAVWPIRLVGNS